MIKVLLGFEVKAYLEPIWQHFGYKLFSEMKVKFSWKQIDSDQVQENILELWHKKI